MTNNNNNNYKIKKGVTRLLKECQEVDTAAILLSERLHVEDLKIILANARNEDDGDDADVGALMNYVNCGALHLRSSLDQIPSNKNQMLEQGEDDNNSEDEEEFNSYQFYSQGKIGISPNPASVIDSLNSVTIQPRGFGGSSGFGTQKQDPKRSPIPKHTV
eukprot:5133685-Ditylum_brightwellii.AAC.1